MAYQYFHILLLLVAAGVAHTFYTDASKQGKASYISEDLSKVVQSPYNSVQKLELYAIPLDLTEQMLQSDARVVSSSQWDIWDNPGFSM
ncbi:hypothetical protein STEG23_003330, partial [Scotinomys teguina]